MSNKTNHPLRYFMPVKGSVYDFTRYKEEPNQDADDEGGQEPEVAE